MDKCLICKGKTEFFFEKSFNHYKGLLDKAQYFRCKHCGFVYSQTHYELDPASWELLNKKYCENSYIDNLNDFSHRPPYLQQALLLNILEKHNLTGKNQYLDYGCGMKFFANILNTYFSLRIDSYDKYINPDFKPKPQSYDVVFSSAVIEHITSIETLDEMMAYLKNEGIFMFHTLVCEKIPQSPEWFYLLPVHCSFFTNKSMSILMEKYGFTCSIYSPLAKSWVFFKNNPSEIETKINNINSNLLNNYLVFKKGFVDYWKGFD